jgi:tetratricopeptide (TPR) repeat protein
MKSWLNDGREVFGSLSRLPFVWLAAQIAILVALNAVTVLAADKEPKTITMEEPNRSKPEDASIHIEAAERCLKNNDFDNALANALRADAFLLNVPGSGQHDRIRAQLVLSSAYLAKNLPAQAEKCAVLGIKLWESSSPKSLEQLFSLHDLGARALAAQGKHAEVLKLVNGVAAASMGDLAEHDIETTPILLQGYNSALALGDYESAVRFVRLDVELHRMASDQARAGSEISAFRRQFLIQGQLLLGTALSMNRDHAGAIEVLSSAAAEAQAAGIEHLRRQALMFLGNAFILAGQVRDGAAALTNAANSAYSGDPSSHVPIGESPDPTVQELLALYKAGQSSRDHLDLGSAKTFWEEGIAKAEKLLKPEDPLIGMFLIGLQSCYYFEGRKAEAFDCFKRALAIAEKHFESDDATVACLLAEVGWGLSCEGRPDRALVFFQRALPATEKAFGSQHPAVERSLRGLMTLYSERREYERALPLCERILAIRETASGSKSPHYADGLDMLAQIYEKKGEIGSAVSLRERSLRIIEEGLGTNSYYLALSLDSLARLYRLQGDLQKATASIERSLEVRQSLFGSENREVATALNELAEVRRLQGQYKEARSLCERSVAILEKSAGSDDVETMQALDGLAATLQFEGNYDTALSVWKRSLAMAEARFGPQHRQVAYRLLGLAAVHRAQGNSPEVAALLTRAQGIIESASGLEDVGAQQN